MSMLTNDQRRVLDEADAALYAIYATSAELSGRVKHKVPCTPGPCYACMWACLAAGLLDTDNLLFSLRLEFEQEKFERVNGMLKDAVSLGERLKTALAYSTN